LFAAASAQVIFNQLQWSPYANRTNQRPLDGANFVANATIYATFLTAYDVTTLINKVKFFSGVVNAASCYTQTSNLLTKEGSAPFDVKGGDVDAAKPYQPTLIGENVITTCYSLLLTPTIYQTFVTRFAQCRPNTYWEPISKTCVTTCPTGYVNASNSRCQPGIFIGDAQNRVFAEVESHTPALWPWQFYAANVNLTLWGTPVCGTWQRSFAGFSGTGFYWQGGYDYLTFPGNYGGVLLFKMFIKAGDKRIRIRYWASDSLHNNDVWIRIPGAKNVTGEFPVGSKGQDKQTLDADGWTKAQQNTACGWTWTTKTRAPDFLYVNGVPKPEGRIVWNFPTSKVYDVYIAPRSDLVAIDKIAIYPFNNTAAVPDVNFNETTFNTAVPVIVKSI